MLPKVLITNTVPANILVPLNGLAEVSLGPDGGKTTPRDEVLQLAPELVAKLQNRGCEVSGIRVKVQVSFDRGHRKPIPRKLSKTAQNSLKDLSLNLDSSPLKNALERMAQKKD